MSVEYKGGNSRLLARLLDQMDQPMCILDRSGQIVFVNRSMCELADQDATVLVGKYCSWQMAQDGPLAAVLTAMAPPAGALDGRIVVRRLMAPIVFGSDYTGQLFVPAVSDAGQVEFTWVILGNIDRIQSLLPTDASTSKKPQPDRNLLAIRSRWRTLDGLTALLGTSPAIQLAMQRCQMALTQQCNVMIAGPSGVGKHELANSIFMTRMRHLGLNATLGQCFPVDCRKLDGELIDSMLEIFAGRLTPDLPKVAQQLVLVGVDRISPASLGRVIHWLDVISGSSTVVSTSSVDSTALIGRSEDWAKLTSRLAAIEVVLPEFAVRREDIATLAQQALAEACSAMDRAQLTLARETLEVLQAYSWSGNLRQLRDSMREAVRSAVLTSTIQPNHLPVAIRTFAGAAANSGTADLQPINLDEVLIDIEKVLLRRALKLSPRNRANAARLLGISRPRLLRRIELLGIENPTPNLLEEDDASENETETDGESKS